MMVRQESSATQGGVIYNRPLRLEFIRNKDKVNLVFQYILILSVFVGC